MIFTVSVLPEPDSPLTSTDWSSPRAAPRAAAPDTL